MIESKLKNNEKHFFCPDCGLEQDLTLDMQEGDIISCSGCGLEFEIKKSTTDSECLIIQELTIEGEDWGE